MEAMTKHRSHSTAFERQVAEEFIAGETLHALSKRHDISRQLIRIWVGKFEAVALDDDVQAADLIQEHSTPTLARLSSHMRALILLDFGLRRMPVFAFRYGFSGATGTGLGRAARGCTFDHAAATFGAALAGIHSPNRQGWVSELRVLYEPIIRQIRGYDATEWEIFTRE